MSLVGIQRGGEPKEGGSMKTFRRLEGIIKCGPYPKFSGNRGRVGHGVASDAGNYSKCQLAEEE